MRFLCNFQKNINRLVTDSTSDETLSILVPIYKTRFCQKKAG